MNGEYYLHQRYVLKTNASMHFSPKIAQY